jgi:hypothetical protein
MKSYNFSISREMVWGNGRKRLRLKRRASVSFDCLEVSSNIPIAGLAHIRRLKIGNVVVVDGWHDLVKPIVFAEHVSITPANDLFVSLRWAGGIVPANYVCGFGFLLSIDLKGVVLSDWERTVRNNPKKVL